ncbi:MAG: hypothetical protein QM778_33450 [Myxococcales bacterium]
MPESREIIIPHRRPIQPTSGVRSTLVQSSLATLKTLGHYELYLELLNPVHRDTILSSIAASWLPLDVALAHYQACDDLRLTDSQLVAIGEAVGDRMQGSFMETLTRAARGMGVTPWLLLKRFDVLWDRLLQGGSIELTKVGPKDLTIEIRHASLPRYAYFRTAFCGVVRAGYKYVGVRAAYVRVADWNEAQDRFLMRAAWV